MSTTRRNVRRSLGTAACLAIVCVAAVSSLAPATADARPAVDRNRDHIADRWERRYGLSLRVKQTFRNQDRDELFNVFEYVASTSPRRADTDRDGIRDGLENPDGDSLANGEEQYLMLHPRKADTDGDGVEDGDEDADGDGVSNHDEFVAGTDPLSACDGDEDLDAALRKEMRMGREFRSVLRWFPVADYFDGDVDSDCADAGEDGDEGEDEWTEDGEDGMEEAGAGEEA